MKNTPPNLGAYSLPLFSPSRVLDLIDYKFYAWPGHGLSDDAKGYQFLDGEYMKADEYGAFLRDPSGFFMRTYLPRTFGVFKPFDMFSALPTNVELLMLDYTPLSMPQMQESLETLAEAGREYAPLFENDRAVGHEGDGPGISHERQGLLQSAL